MTPEQEARLAALERKVDLILRYAPLAILVEQIETNARTEEAGRDD